MTCQHDWHFIEGTERLRCERCKQETGPKSYEQRVEDFMQEPWTTEQLSVPAGQHLSIGNLKPSYNVTFHNNLHSLDTGKMVGKLDFNGPELVFEGDAAESAKVFIDWVATAFHGRLAEERQKELDACCELLEGMHAASTGSHNYYLHAANELRKLRGKA
jgi:hypothetical protein